MKKRIAIGMVTAMVLSMGVACASPYEMEEGKWNTNIGVMFSPDTGVDDGDGEIDLDGDTSWYGNITYGINDKWGVQLDYNHYNANFDAGRYHPDIKVDATELNVLYQLNPNLNVFAGYVYAGANMSVVTGPGMGFSEGAHTDGVQIGIQGWYPLSDRFKTFGKIGIGNNSRIYELGFSYALNDDWDVDLSYRDAEYQDFDDVLEYNVDGLRLGVSTTF